MATTHLVSRAASATSAAAALLLLCAPGVLSQTAPHISIIGFAPALWDPVSNPCPFPAADPVYSCAANATRLNVIGDHFGAATGGAIQVGGAIPPPPPPALPPADLPDALSLASLLSGVGANTECVASSLYTGDGNAYRFCPYTRIDLNDPRANHAYVSHLGEYQGVVRTFIPENNCTAVTGHLYGDGDMCNGAPRSAIITFTCIDTTSPQQEYYTRVPQVYSAMSTDGGCSFDLDYPIPAACPGPAFSLCADAFPTPNPLPSPSPSFVYTNAFISSWSDREWEWDVCGAHAVHSSCCDIEVNAGSR